MIGKIENIEKLANALESNEFYDFHDAEIVSIKFDLNDLFTAEVILQLHRRIAEFEIEGQKFDRWRNFDVMFKFYKGLEFRDARIQSPKRHWRTYHHAERRGIHRAF